MMYRARAGMPVCDGSVLQSASLKFLNVQTVLRKDRLFARSLARPLDDELAQSPIIFAPRHKSVGNHTLRANGQGAC